VSRGEIGFDPNRLLKRLLRQVWKAGFALGAAKIRQRLGIIAALSYGMLRAWP
jgi:hypothetical protein